MKRDSNLYIFIYSFIMVVVVAVLLALASTALRPAQEENVRMEKRLDILKSIGMGAQAEQAEQKMDAVNQLYEKYIVSTAVVDGRGASVAGAVAFDIDLRGELGKEPGEQRLPLFIARLDDGSTKYIFPLAGQGLWGPIWGYIALDDDLNRVYGVSFAHKSETPGLGAEIATPEFCGRFPGKVIFQGADFVGLKVLKGSDCTGQPHAVDGISGGTLTSQGVEQMLTHCLADYQAYIQNERKGGQRHE